MRACRGAAPAYQQVCTSFRNGNWNKAMTERLNLMLDAHGMARWKRFKRIEGNMSITGMICARKGWSAPLRSWREFARNDRLRARGDHHGYRNANRHQERSTEIVTDTDMFNLKE
jgi:hypothetical protein